MQLMQEPIISPRHDPTLVCATFIQQRALSFVKKHNFRHVKNSKRLTKYPREVHFALQPSASVFENL